MSDFQSRFRNLDPDEEVHCIAELREAVTVGKRQLLNSEELEELLELLPSDVFRLLRRERIRELKRKSERPEEHPDVDAEAEEWAKGLANAAEGAGDWPDEVKVDLDTIATSRPALWYKIYKALKRMGMLDLAVEMLPRDRGSSVQEALEMLLDELFQARVGAFSFSHEFSIVHGKEFFPMFLPQRNRGFSSLFPTKRGGHSS